MIIFNKFSEAGKNKVSQKLYDYLAEHFREYCNFSYVNFYEPSTTVLNMSSYAKSKIQKFSSSATLPNSYILFEFEVIPKFDGLANLIIADDFLRKFDIDAKYASLIYKNYFQNTQTCIVNNLIYMCSGMSTGHNIWETVHDLATIKIMGTKDYVPSNDIHRYERTFLLEKDLKEKGWNVNYVIKQLIHSGNNNDEIKKCFGYYFEFPFSNTIGYIYPKN